MDERARRYLEVRLSHETDVRLRGFHERLDRLYAALSARNLFHSGLRTKLAIQLMADISSEFADFSIQSARELGPDRETYPMVKSGDEQLWRKLAAHLPMIVWHADGVPTEPLMTEEHQKRRLDAAQLVLTQVRQDLTAKLEATASQFLPAQHGESGMPAEASAAETNEGQSSGDLSTEGARAADFIVEREWGAQAADEWMSAADTMALMRTAMSRHNACIAIAERANAGLLRSRAELAFVNENTFVREELPERFWMNPQSALSANWVTGDFETRIRSGKSWKAFNVEFFRSHVEKIIPPGAAKASEGAPVTPADTSETLPEVVLERGPDGEKEKPTRSGGRQLSGLWPEFVAELVAYIHDNGVPPGRGSDGQTKLIEAIADQLAARGLEAPSRTTVQPTIGAVLARLRSAGN